MSEFPFLARPRFWKSLFTARLFLGLQKPNLLGFWQILSPGLGLTGSLFTEKEKKTSTVECEDLWHFCWCRWSDSRRQRWQWWNDDFRWEGDEANPAAGSDGEGRVGAENLPKHSEDGQHGPLQVPCPCSIMMSMTISVMMVMVKKPRFIKKI